MSNPKQLREREREPQREGERERGGGKDRERDIFTNFIHRQVESEYSVLFEDNTYLEGFSPPLDVPQRYVLPMRETRRRQAQ